MTEPASRQARELHERLIAVWSNLPGWGRLAAVNHTSIGLRFMLTGAVFFLIGATLAMLMRTQLALPEQEIIGPAQFNQLFTMHGTVMMFLFAIPMLEGVALYLIPKMIGARDLLFPRISAFGYYCYLFGGLILLSSLFLGIAPDSGWFMYTPLSSAAHSPGAGSDFWLLGVTFVEIAALGGAVELVATILRGRAPGMSLRKMPIFCWYILAMALMMVFGFPPLILGSILLELERAAGMPFFDVAGGGSPLLWQHLFWLFGHPEVYIIFLPAAGIVSTLIPVYAQRPLAGYRWVVMAVIATAFISFGLWVHHMFTVGIPQLALAFFSVASMLVAIPTGIQLFAWLATLWSGRVIFSLPMLWIIGFLVIFVAGGLTGVMLALVPFNWQVHDTQFVVAHFHYVLVGGMLFPLLAGLYHWLPLLSGRLPSPQLGRWGFWFTFIGFNATFLVMHLTGLRGMPRRVYTYEAGVGFDWLNLVSSVGGFVMAIGIGLIIVDVLMHLRFGRPAPRNPWRADTLEWALPTRPPPYNFASLPTVDTRHPLWEDPGLGDSMAAGEHGLAGAAHGRRETFGTDPISGKPRDVVHLPSNSWWPLSTALALAVLCISLLVKAYPPALLASLAALALLLRWSWENGAQSVTRSPAGGEPPDAPLHWRGTDGPGLWGMVVALMANATLYGSLLFGWLFLWTASPQWTVPEERAISLPGLMLSGIPLSIAVLLYHRVVVQLRTGKDRRLTLRLWLVAGLATLHLLMLAAVLWNAPLRATELAHDAVLMVMLIYLLMHAGLATAVTLLQIPRVRRGYVGARLPYETIVLRPLWLYTLAVFWVSVAVFLLLPMAWGGA